MGGRHRAGGRRWHVPSIRRPRQSTLCAQSAEDADRRLQFGSAALGGTAHAAQTLLGQSRRCGVPHQERK